MSSPLVVGLLCTLTIVFAFGLRASRNDLSKAKAALQTSENELQEARRDEVAYRDVLKHQYLPSPVLTGADVLTGGADYELSGNRTTLVYLIESACAACELNYDFLRSVAGRWPGSVAAISLRDEPEVLLNYSREHHLPFPVVAQPRGPLVELAPRHGTPITLIAQAHHVIAIMPGRLDDAQRRAIERLLSGDPAESDKMAVVK